MVGVIIPVWKGREVLPHALDSLVAQTKKLFVVCLSIDGDGEDYSDIVEEYRRRGLKIVVVNSDVNGGPGIARQRGIDHMSQICDYIMFLDADDMLMPQAVGRLYEEAKRNNLDIIQSSIVADSTAAPDHVLWADKTPVTWTHGKIYRTSYLREKDIRFIPEIRLNEDSYFNVVAANVTSNKAYLNDITYYWSDNPNSLTRKDPSKFFEISWVQYVMSQVFGMMKIWEIDHKKLTPTLFGLTALNVYWHHIQARHEKLDETPCVELLNVWKEFEPLQSLLDAQDFWMSVAQEIKGCKVEKGALIFPKQNFADWVNQYIRKETK